LQSAISLGMIRGFLGRVDDQTPQIYARANLEMKRDAFEKPMSLPQFRRSPAGKTTRAFLTGAALCSPQKDMRACRP
jgi:integrase/recombinase XerD